MIDNGDGDGWEWVGVEGGGGEDGGGDDGMMGCGMRDDTFNREPSVVQTSTSNTHSTYGGFSYIHSSKTF